MNSPRHKLNDGQFFTAEGAIGFDLLPRGRDYQRLNAGESFFITDMFADFIDVEEVAAFAPGLDPGTVGTDLLQMRANRKKRTARSGTLQVFEVIGEVVNAQAAKILIPRDL